MSTPAPAPNRPGFDLSNWLPAKRSLLWVLLAFVAGLALFALILSRTPDRDAFFRADPNAPSASPTYAPLPAPLPAEGDDNASGMGQRQPAPSQDEEKPRLVETAPPAPPPSLPKPVQPTPSVATTRPEPIAGQTPAPRYPTLSLRRGESGTVTVRAQIGADGEPTSVEVATSSGSRNLDRAATDAVKRWHFRPAMSNGQPVSGTIVVPISFEPRR